MDEWQHYCHGARRTLLVPANEQCDRCGLAAGEDHYFDRLEGWLGFGETNTPPAGVEGKCECGLSEVACRDPLRRSCPDGVKAVDERAAFEAWHTGKYGRAYTEWIEAKGRYAWDLTEELWTAWKAARAHGMKGTHESKENDRG